MLELIDGIIVPFVYCMYIWTDYLKRTQRCTFRYCVLSTHIHCYCYHLKCLCYKV